MGQPLQKTYKLPFEIGAFVKSSLYYFFLSFMVWGAIATVLSGISWLTGLINTNAYMWIMGIGCFLGLPISLFVCYGFAHDYYLEEAQAFYSVYCPQQWRVEHEEAKREPY